MSDHLWRTYAGLLHMSSVSDEEGKMMNTTAKFNPEPAVTLSQFKRLTVDLRLAYLAHRGVSAAALPKEVGEKDEDRDFLTEGFCKHDLEVMLEDLEEQYNEHLQVKDDYASVLEDLFEELEDPERDRLEAVQEASELEAQAAALQRRAAHLKNQALR